MWDADSRATPRREGCRVGGCTRFCYKDEGKFLQNVWKNQFQTFPYKMFFIFHFSFFILHCNYWIRDQLFFCLISDKGRGDGKMFVKMGYPGLGWGDTRARLGRRLPPHRHGVGGWKKIKQIGSLSFLQFPKFL